MQLRVLSSRRPALTEVPWLHCPPPHTWDISNQAMHTHPSSAPPMLLRPPCNSILYSSLPPSQTHLLSITQTPPPGRTSGSTGKWLLVLQLLQLRKGHPREFERVLRGQWAGPPTAPIYRTQTPFPTRSGFPSMPVMWHTTDFHKWMNTSNPLIVPLSTSWQVCFCSVTVFVQQYFFHSCLNLYLLLYFF